MFGDAFDHKLNCDEGSKLACLVHVVNKDAVERGHELTVREFTRRVLRLNCFEVEHGPAAVVAAHIAENGRTLSTREGSDTDLLQGCVMLVLHYEHQRGNDGMLEVHLED